MRLLTTSFTKNRGDPPKLEEFFGSDIPPYAILSHTWGREEVTFQDLASSTEPLTTTLALPNSEDVVPQPGGMDTSTCGSILAGMGQTLQLKRDQNSHLVQCLQYR
jgi:hypothetical protein